MKLIKIKMVNGCIRGNRKPIQIKELRKRQKAVIVGPPESC